MMEKQDKICKVCEGKVRSPLTYLDNTPEGTPAQNTLKSKGQEKCYQNFFKKSASFVFFIKSIPTVPDNNSNKDAPIATAPCINPTMSANRGAVPRISLMNT